MLLIGSEIRIFVFRIEDVYIFQTLCEVFECRPRSPPPGFADSLRPDLSASSRSVAEHLALPDHETSTLSDLYTYSHQSKMGSITHVFWILTHAQHALMHENSA